MNKNKLLLYGFIIILSLFLTIRNHNVYNFRSNVIGLIMNYNEKHYFNGQIRKVNDIMPGYYSMLLSLKPLKYEYWISKKNMKKLTERNDILI